MPLDDLRALPERLLTDDHDYVFVVTYGRTGSTLVQGLLNALPRTLVRGENGMFHVHQWRAAEAAVSVAERNMGSRPRQPTSAFYGGHLLGMARFVESSRAFTKELLLGRKRARAFDRLGFKEVRWHEIGADETEAFFAWFEQVFPGARYVLNTRDPEQTAGSGFWQRLDRDEAVQKMMRVREIQDFLRHTRPDRVVDTHYEVITGDDTGASDAELAQLAGFVTGKPCDKKLLATLRTVLATGHGPNPFGASRGRRGKAKE
jgi:hypothetical protein